MPNYLTLFFLVGEDLLPEQETIGDYRVLEPLGSGAVGQAFRAEHVGSGDVVAVKLMHERLALDPDVQNRFVREVSVLEKLDHPNIVRHLDCGLDDGRLFFAMEWVEFGTLGEVLGRRTKLPWREAVECAIEICAGLRHAHERGIVHRDLKPANLFLSADGKVKIGDFGLARDDAMHRLTLSGNTVGSCRYMAPEQVRGEEHLTGAVDLYALGCLLYQMLDGEPPFDGATIIEIFEHHLFTEVSPLPKPSDDRPAALDKLVMQLLVKYPNERPADAGEVRAALAAILAGQEPATEFTMGEPPEAIATEGETPRPSDMVAEAANDDQPESGLNLTQRLMQDDSRGGALWSSLAVLVGMAVMVGVILFIASRR